MKDCVFCKVITAELPSYKVYEDDLFIAILDIFPRTKGHTLVIPKTHYRWTYDVPEFKEYWEAVLKITKGMQSALDPTFVAYVTHGLEVPHAHIHVMPRYSDETSFVPDVKKFSKEEFEEIAKKLREGIAKAA